MNLSDFSRIASGYDKKGIVQKAASEKLFNLLSIGAGEDVLDLGCGTGSLTRRIRGMTTGKVVGADPAVGMIEKAVQASAGLDIEYRNIGASELDYESAFDAIFVNSAFQWFQDPLPVLGLCHKALRPGGRIGVQAPAKEEYSPQFLAIVNRVAEDARTAETFRSFNSPWFFLETAGEYSKLFSQTGFKVEYSSIERTSTQGGAKEAMGIFESGAAAGYWNPELYTRRLTPGYLEAFREIAQGYFAELAAKSEDGFEVEFNRIYLVANKPA